MEQKFYANFKSIFKGWVMDNVRISSLRITAACISRANAARDDANAWDGEQEQARRSRKFYELSVLDATSQDLFIVGCI